METRIELWLYLMSDVAFIQQLIELDWDDFSDWKIIDLINLYCDLKKKYQSEFTAQSEFVKICSDLFFIKKPTWKLTK